MLIPDYLAYVILCENENCNGEHILKEPATLGTTIGAKPLTDAEIEAAFALDLCNPWTWNRETQTALCGYCSEEAKKEGFI